jgi:hypothetical protein
LVNIIKCNWIYQSQITLWYNLYIFHSLIVTIEILVSVSLCSNVITLTSFNCKKTKKNCFQKHFQKIRPIGNPDWLRHSLIHRNYFCKKTSKSKKIKLVCKKTSFLNRFEFQLCKNYEYKTREYMSIGGTGGGIQLPK